MIYAISIGTNTGHRLQNIQKAIAEIKSGLGEVLQVSAVYESEPWGFESKNWFYNVVLTLQSNIDPQGLMTTLLDIEKKMGRERNAKGYADRCIDLDIILCNECTICSPNLTLPHPHMHERLFVLLPLQELMPQWIHPVYQKNINEMIRDSRDHSKINKLMSSEFK
ncbi:MAG TPA: 2-amino-4-hydroxy-6-hydroxymethyldihydropteridine diphosphokinase [Bacteroidales bacterium]|jgi:2-amino-4-hydroxy-6-hydroxymethyldihydropteridine diphosphokinase|nr:2-amino-4-hydroxy-6-hydroxymethyldihydropteridine diphosphokinase [Bacteroidales bacterium]